MDEELFRTDEITDEEKTISDRTCIDILKLLQDQEIGLSLYILFNCIGFATSLNIKKLQDALGGIDNSSKIHKEIINKFFRDILDRIDDFVDNAKDEQE